MIRCQGERDEAIRDREDSYMTIYHVLYKLYAILPVKIFKRQILGLYREFCLRNARKGILVAKREGIVYELDLAERIDNSIYHIGCYEPHVTKAIGKLCHRGMTVLDVGANIGAHSFRFGKLVGPEGRVIAFEPTIWAFRKLERNLSLNNFENIEIVKMALSDSVEHHKNIKFCSSWPLGKENDNDQSHPFHHGHADEDSVEFCTLDEAIRKRQLGKVDLIKIDVDGYELKVCKGGIRTLKEHTPTLILEVGEPTMNEVGDSPMELIMLLFDQGYEFYDVREFKKFKGPRAVADLLEEKRVSNFVVAVSTPS